jgi:hypothetical protein
MRATHKQKTLVVPVAPELSLSASLKDALNRRLSMYIDQIYRYASICRSRCGLLPVALATAQPGG